MCVWLIFPFRFLSVSQRSCTSSTWTLYFSTKACLLSCRWSYFDCFSSLEAGLPRNVINRNVYDYKMLFLFWVLKCDPNKIWLSLGINVGLHPPSGHYLQLQPAAECLGICPVVQHDQSGYQGLKCTTLSALDLNQWQLPKCSIDVCLLFKDVIFFANCPAATWPQFGEMLSWQFLAATKRGLNDAQLEMIACKLFGKSCCWVLSLGASTIAENTIIVFWVFLGFLSNH